MVCSTNGENDGETFENDEEVYTNPGINVPAKVVSSNGSLPSCLTVKLVVYYDLNFKDGLGGGSNTASEAKYVCVFTNTSFIIFYSTDIIYKDLIQRVEEIIALAETHVHTFTPAGAAWENMEVKLDILGIDLAPVVYESNDWK